MAKNRVNVGLSKETHEAASNAAHLLKIDLQDMVERAVQKFLKTKERETQKKRKELAVTA